jgi:hypothetical protein
VANGTGAILCKSTGLGVEEMDRRYWDLYPHAGKDAYLEIVDRSPNGHINVDDIIERPDRLTLAQGDGKSKRKPATATERTTPDGAAVVLRQNTPNPFNPTTMIAFELPAPARVVLDVFDVGGALVDRLAEGPWAAGPHRVTWDGTDASGEPVSSGVYFYRLTVDGRVAATRKMALLK